ncbi:putative ribonuclease H-like domain-containing protein [Tanacetum coccineum]
MKKLILCGLIRLILLGKKQLGNPYSDLKDQGVFDSGCSRHMTRNKAYLTDYQEIDGGFVAFGGSPKGGKITGKDESNLWHKRLGHISFKTMNKLVKGNLARGLPSKIFENDYSCVACQKGKQNKASCKTKTVSSIDKPLQILHMDLFGPVSVRSLNKKMYCLVVTDDYIRFSWVFFLATKDETSGILKTFITGIENQLEHRVKIIRCDNGTEFKNHEMNQFCDKQGIKREFSVPRTPQQNGVAERKNITLIEAARTMLTDSKLPTTFWGEAVNTACYVQNRVLVIKPHNKTPYEPLHGRPPIVSFMRPFECLVTILNTLDHPGKFDRKSNEGFFVGYSINSKAFRVFNTGTRIVEESFHITFLENKPNVAGVRPEWPFDIDSLTMSMNYKPVTARNQTNGNTGFKDDNDAGSKDAEKELTERPANEAEQNNQALRDDLERLMGQENAAKAAADTSSTNIFSTINTPVTTVSSSFVNTATPQDAYSLPDDPNMPPLEDLVYSEEDENAGIFVTDSPIPITRGHKDHPVNQIIGDLYTTPQTRRMTKQSGEQALIEPKKVIQALTDPSWIEAMQEELLQFKLQKVWTLIDLPIRKRAIGTKWVFRNKKDERRIVVKNKTRLMDVKSVFLYDTIKEEDKYVADILKKFDFAIVKTASTPLKPNKSLLKDEEADDVDVHLYRSMIGSLMYLTTSRHDIMYLKGQPKLGLWYPRDFPFELEAFTDSDYAGASLDRKSTTGGCQFLGKRLISWQCKK